MTDENGYDLDYRPRSYWGPQDLETHYGAKAKGELRRRSGLSLLGEGIADGGMLASSLPDDERSTVGAIHPWFMGGEYLPDFLSNEVEIARVTMKSTTMDVISLRARFTKHRIKYRIVDEYGDMTDEGYVTQPATSKRPLTLKQVIDNINLNDLIDGPREGNYEGGSYCGPDEIFNFCTVSSAFYSELDHWFDDANEEWRVSELSKMEEY
jgi:hypothetical protein